MRWGRWNSSSRAYTRSNGAPGIGSPAAEVLRLEGALAVARAVQHRQRHGAERGVRVDAQHAARGPDPLGHRAHRLARPAAGVQAAGARSEADLVQQPPGRDLPRAGLHPQPLVLLRRVPQRVDGLRPLGLGGAHRPCPLSARRTLVRRTASIDGRGTGRRWATAQSPSQCAQTCGTPPGAVRARHGRPG